MKIRFAAACIALAVAGTACPGDDSGGTGGNTLAEGGSGDDTAGTMGSSFTAGSMSSTTATTTMTGGGSETAGGSDTGPVEPQPDGAMCMENAECISMKCFYIALLGGVCGECLTDADCPDGGCSLPNPLSDPPMGAHCNTGQPGDGCMSDDVCATPEAPLCAVIIEVPGVITASGCSECIMDSDCPMGLLCSPTVDLMTISGQKSCVEPGSVPNGQACDFMTTGNEACMSGICGVFDVMGLVQVGVCGECGVDADCPMGEICHMPNADVMTGEITPPLCGPP
jgi:hypothetical protein